MRQLMNRLRSLRGFLREVRRDGLRYACNMRHFRRHYMTRHPPSVARLYRDAPLPSYVEIEVTTHCNLRCAICEHTYWREPSRHMPMDAFLKILDQFPVLRWVGLTGIGESFLHPEFPAMVREVKRRGAHLELYDTFYFIDDAMGRFLLDVGCDTLLASLDAATPETYSRLRRGSDFARVTGNLRRLFTEKRRGGFHKPELAFHFIVNTLNRHELVPFVRLARELGGGPARVEFTRLLHPYPEVAELFCEITPAEREAVMAAGRETGMTIGWNADTRVDKPPCAACTAWTMPFIFVTGEVIPCCSGNEANARDRQKETSMGNIFTTPLREIWNGTRYRELRQSLRAGRFPDACRNCCLYREGSSAT
jgi:MoaA/NifB/PqqE/SkfB family radical SAM enzyme